jgi:PAS domain S-box-containing protein
VAAEIARIEARDLDAMRLYEQAIRSAHANGFIHNEALAYEVAARFYAARGFEKIANAYLQDARYSYLRWGADGKVQQLERLYPHPREQELLAGPKSTIGAPVENLDLATFLKVSQAVSGEIVLENLIHTLLRTAIEQAGAERGLLILPQGAELRIQAEAVTAGSSININLIDRPISNAELPEQIVQYAARAQEIVILDDASNRGSFSTDEYIGRMRVRSILCLPLVKQGRLIAVLYLQNNLAANVFTARRIAVLKVLASAAAISLENGRLYRELEEREAKIGRLVDANIVGIFIWNIDGRIIEANDAFLRVVGYDRDDLVRGRLRWTDLTPPEWLERDTQEWVPKLNTTGSLPPFEKEYFRKDGNRVPVLTGAASFKGSGDEGVAFVLDLSDRKRAEEALHRSQLYLSEGQRLAHMGSWAFNPSGFFEYWSQELFQIYGLEPEKGAPTLEQYLATIHPQDRDFMADTIKRMHAERGGCDVKMRIVRPDGEQRYIRCVGIPVIEGEVLKGFLGTAIDITEHELLTQELERRQRYLAEAQRLTDTSSWAWRVVDRSAVHLSEEWYRIFGFNPAEGAPAWEKGLQRVHPEDRLKWMTTIERAILEKADYDLEFRIVVPGGMVKWIHTVGHPVLTAAGELVQFLGSSTDITELKRAEEERERLRQLEADLAHINRVNTMGEMAASLAHEIKQPIAAAITSANTCIEWLAHEPPNLDRARAAARRVERDGTRAAEIIDHLRSLYKKSPPQRELVDVNGIIHEMLALLRGEAARYSIAMCSELAADLPKIMADRVQLQQVFMNLMLNGIQAMEDSGGELTIKSQLQDSQLLISVSDTGVGLPTEKVDQIFSAFFTTKPQGSGMGLAISRSIVEAHDGRLWAACNSGQGATFHFTLAVPSHATSGPSQ